ncbi:hypothetical protein [Thalassotalea atypica]|uniref:hypothetical protein n=1 Tax=Thalassotalea atypica TaxID=2054316 RepID=UPI00257327F9|nr:hypothetical protein [Thalassotalea atypica]
MGIAVDLMPFTVMKGHQVASGLAINSPYPQGTIALQSPFFRQQGLDLTPYFMGTINAAFACKSIKLKAWDHEVKRLVWFPELPCEDFKFAHCHVIYQNQSYPALIYQPTAETKIGHFQPKNTLEIISEEIKGLKYGVQATLQIAKQYLIFEYD